MEFENFTRLHEKLFAVFGFDILISEGDPCIWPIFAIVVIINFYLYVSTLLSYCIANILNIESAVNTMTILLACIPCLVKMAFFYIYRKEFIGVIWKLRSVSTKDNLTDTRILEAENKKVTIITKIFVCLVSLSVAISILMPLGRMAFLFWKYGQVSYLLPVKGLYPFDLENPSVFSLTFLWNVTAIFGGGIYTASMDTLFFAISFNLFAHLQILNRKIEPVKIDVNQDLEKQIGKIISRHQLIFDLIKEVNALFRPILFTQFLMGATQLCTASFQMVVLHKDPQVLFFFCFLPACLVQLFGFCYCGDRIQSESGAFATHIYLGYWYTFPPKIARCLYLSMLRSQRPSKLDGYFFEANLITFNSILTTTYSYMAFLRSKLEQ